MQIFERYIIKSIFISLIYCLVILTGIVWFSQILKLLFLFEKEVNLLEFLELAIFILPLLIHSILPFAILYASLYVYNNMKVNKELVVFENAGMNYRLLTKPIFTLGIAIVFVSMINSVYIMPKSYNILKDRLSTYRNNFVISTIQEGVFNNLSKNLIVYLNTKKTGTEYNGLILFDSRNPKKFSILMAKHGKMLLQDGSVNLNLQNGQKQTINEKGIPELMSFEKSSINIPIEKAKIRQINDKDMNELYIWELFSQQTNSYRSKTKLLSEGNNRLIWPMFNIILPLVAISIFLKADFNRKHYLKYLIKSCFVAIIFVIVHFFTVNLAIKNPIFNYFMYINILVGAITYYFLTMSFQKFHED